MKRLFFATAVGACSLGAFAGTYTWQGFNGSIDDPSCYNPAGLSKAGDVADFSANASYTVTFPSGSPYALLSKFNINAPSAGNTATFDGRNADLYPPDQASAVYNAEPFKLYACGGLLLDMEDYWGDAAQRKMYSPFRFTDFLFRVSAAADIDKVEFVEGTYCFNYGNSSTRKNLLFAYGTTGTDKKLAIEVGKDSSMTFAPILWSVRGRNSVMRFAGGRHFQNGSYQHNEMTYSNGDTEAGASKASFEVLGKDASFTFAAPVDVGKNIFPNRTFTFLAADGGTVDFNGGANAYHAGTHVFVATNGASFVFNGANLGENNTGIVKMTVVDSTFKTSGRITYLGGTTEATGGFTGGFTNSVWNLLGALYIQNAKPGSANRSSSDVSLKNCTVESSPDGQVHVFGGDFNVEDSVLDMSGGIFADGGNTRLDNCKGKVSWLVLGKTEDQETGNVTIDGGALTLDGILSIAYNNPCNLSITGGKHVFNTRFMTEAERKFYGFGTANPRPVALGEYEGGAGTMTISGDDTEVSVYAPEFYVGNRGDGTLDIRGGKLSVDSPSSPVYLGSGEKSKAVFKISGGEFTTGSTIAGTRGNVEILQTGGVINAKKLLLGSYARTAGYTSNNPMTYKITDGALNCSEWISITDKQGFDSKLVLDGGVVSCTLLCGGNGSQWNGGDGTSVLQANGGTVRPIRALNNFITQFDKAEVGPQGLSIDAGCDITVPQSFTAIAGGKGKIVKKGAGTLTLAGTIAEDVIVEVREGTVVFENENKMKGSLVVAGGTALFKADNTIASLVFGDENSMGAIDFESGVSLSVAGEIAEIHNGSKNDFVYEKDNETGITSISKDEGDPAGYLIKLDSGTSNATENVSFRYKDSLEMSVAYGSLLTASGNYARGALKKTGQGKVVLSNPLNAFVGGIEIVDGMLSFANFGAMGGVYMPNSAIEQKGGTLEYSGESAVLDIDYTANAPSSTDAVVFKTDSDVVLRGKFGVESGALVKRGKGKLVIEATEDAVVAVDNGKVTERSDPPSGTIAFDPNGVAPTAGYTGFNVVEGELELRGPAKYSVLHAATVGGNPSEGSAKATLTFRDTEVSLDSPGYLLSAGPRCSETSLVQTQAVNVVNSTVSGDTPFIPGWKSSSSKQRIEITVDNSTIVSSYAYYLNMNSATKDGAYHRFKNGSNLYAAKDFRVEGYAECEFDSSLLAANANLAGIKFTLRNENKNLGFLRMNADSHLYLDEINPLGAYGRFAFRFNGGTWHASAADTALKVKFLFGDWDPSAIKIIFEEGGCIFPVSEGNTLTVTHNLEGEGGFVKTGKGTMVFDTWTKWGDDTTGRSVSEKWEAHPVTWSFDGEAVVEEGTLAVKAGAVREGAKIRIAEGAVLQSEDSVLTNAVLRGAGTISGGKFVNCTVKTPLEDDGAVASSNMPVFDSSASGKFSFDFGFAEDEVLVSPYPADVVVAKWTGEEKPDVSLWRVAGIGKMNLSSTFTAHDDGTVTATIKPEGMFLFIK